MAKKCLTAAAKKGVFVQNAIHTDIFDLMPESGANLPFSYFRRSLPIQPYLIAQGAKYVVESHKGITKVLHTGLRPTKVNGIYSGDVFNPQTRSKSLILFCFNSAECSYTAYLFEGYFPKSLNKVLNEILAL
ncbi:MAG: hypothetical protein PHR83_05700 [Paludibacter sp.]|nr:hypothetical protein [Paludibacter sp.]